MQKKKKRNRFFLFPTYGKIMSLFWFPFPFRMSRSYYEDSWSSPEKPSFWCHVKDIFHVLMRLFLSWSVHNPVFRPAKTCKKPFDLTHFFGREIILLGIGETFSSQSFFPGSEEALRFNHDYSLSVFELIISHFLPFLFRVREMESLYFSSSPDMLMTFFPHSIFRGMGVRVCISWWQQNGEESSFQFTAEDFSFPKFERIQPTLRQIDKAVLLKKKEASSSCYSHKSKISSEPIPQTLFSLFLCVTRVSGIQFINFLYLSLSSPSPPLFPPWDRLQFRVPIF